MLLRLKIENFKNLVDVDVRFGPFTCIAGANAVGKSNLFDAVRFVGALADRSLLDAAMSIRDEGRSANVRSLFHRAGEHYDDNMFFQADMIIPAQGQDDLGQVAEATSTLVRYTVRLAYVEREGSATSGGLELVHEELVPLPVGKVDECIQFPHSQAWRASVQRGLRRKPFIWTEEAQGTRVVKLGQEQGAGRPRQIPTATLPRTVLSGVDAENPTALLARREMQSWRLLQLEPVALRNPDRMTEPPGLQSDGAHLPATLFYLANHYGSREADPHSLSWAYEQVAARLAELIDDVRELHVDRDERRELLTLEVEDGFGTVHPARSLSDGTLRFLALAVLELDPEAQGLLCLEEPENGIHPERIPAMLQLLRDIAVDTYFPVDADNPMRQVIVNTHSPVVVQQVADHELLVAELREIVRSGFAFRGAAFKPLPETWRAQSARPSELVSRGRLLGYLNPSELPPEDRSSRSDRGHARSVRVVDREDLKQLMLPLPEQD